MIAARRALIKDQTAAKNRAKGLRLVLLRRQNTTRLARIGADLAAIDNAIAVLISSGPVLSEKQAVLPNIPGISDVSAAALVALAPELGDLDQRQIAALAGLAPIARQSGTRCGRSFIRGGRSLLREALYMPARTAIRLNPDFKRIYARLTGNGKPAKVATTAVMRKLVILANALIRDKRNWPPEAP